MQADYIPDLDTLMEQKAGVCFDYAALMTDAPQLGYPNQAHIRVYRRRLSRLDQYVNPRKRDGFDNIIYFDGKSW